MLRPPRTPDPAAGDDLEADGTVRADSREGDEGNEQTISKTRALSQRPEASDSQAAQAPSEEARPRQIVGRYSVYNEIASGWMASVHFGRLAGPFGFARLAAIKRPYPQFSRDPHFARMFLEEARLASRIQHTNVVRILDVVATPTDLMIVMEYVHGEPLARLQLAAKRRQQRVPLAIASQIMVDTLHGLHAAHEATDEQGNVLGIVHRDISPQNILVGADGITRLVDFGLARAAGALESSAEPPAVRGKWAYQAPEQVRGEPATRLTDTFAAAVVFWELLTGQRLFGAGSEREVAQRVLRAPIDPPSRFADDLPAEIDAVLLKGLSREPSTRYQTAREMALDIEASVAAIRRSEITGWVEEMAGEVLAMRAASFAEIEKTDSEAGSERAAAPLDSGVAKTEAPSGSRAPPPAPGSATPSARRPPRETGSQAPPSSPVGSAFRTAAPDGRARRRLALLAIVIAVVLAAAAGFQMIASRGPSSAPSGSTALPGAGSASSAGAAMGAASASGDGLTIPASPSTDGNPRPTDSAIPQPGSVPPSRGELGPRPPKGGPSGRSGAKPPECDQPYWLDTLGRKHFKPQCL